MDLDSLPPRWVTLTATSDGLPVITLVDEAVALAAPFPSHPVQVGLGVHLNEPDALGQPGELDAPLLRSFEQALVDALGSEARLVSSLTLQGVREYVAYARSTAVLERWQAEPPPGLDTHDVQVFAIDDPTWKGLREIAGLLEPGEEPLRPDELDER
ncbi:MAG: DUF695 domain-containing protein [Mycobacteriales bacterium]|nr:DUF695 domain-containing protein [Mycobacteriales bacterium]